jgi:hypothetical protein
MQSRLEDVLREKERELRLYEKFLTLARFCEEEVFPSAQVPLQAHVEALKEFIEKLIPEPKDRREEMFSGEVFILLCMLYLHDTGAAAGCALSGTPEIVNALDPRHRTLFINDEIGRRLDMPEGSVELVNSLIFSIKKIPIEWEIAEGPKKAIVRNGPMLGGIFDFAHLMWDVFSEDARHSTLRRAQSPDPRPGCGETLLAVDSREGTISVACSPAFPYQAHLLERTKEYVGRHFARFKETVNGRLGFQYRQILWETPEGHDGERALDAPDRFPAMALESFPYVRWEEASRLLDTLFRHGCVVVVGDATTGKTTMLNSFVAPQLRRISPNVFYAEVWDHPVHDIREAVGHVHRTVAGDPVDIISTCRKLVVEGRGPCFFILDGCERLKGVDPDEAEKLERFIRFCLESENVYLIALGDKDDFLDWYGPFSDISMAAIFEMSPVVRPEAELAPLPAADVIPLEIVDDKVDEVVKRLGDPNDLREIVSVLAGNGERTLKRYSEDEICFETRVPRGRVQKCLELLQAKGIVRRHDVLKTVFWTLSGRRLRERLYRRLGLQAFERKRGVREALRQAAGEARLLDAGVLDAVEELMDGMNFTKREMGLILASMVYHGKDWRDTLERAEKDGSEFDGEFALMLLNHDSDRMREAAIRLLARAKDDALINTLLAHLRKEKSAALRMLLVEGFIETGKRKSIVALMAALSEMGDKDAKAHVVDYICGLPPRTARDLLIEIADVEKDPEMIDRIDDRLSKLEE